MTGKREQKQGLAASARKSAAALKKARERTELELTRRSIDLTTGSPRATMVAAVAVAAALPLADAGNLLDGLNNGTNVPFLEAEGRGQAAPCKKKCGGG